MPPPDPPISPTFLLHAPNPNLNAATVRLALHFALLGRPSTALNLVSKLNTYDYFYGEYSILEPLWTLWDEIGAWPEGEKDRVKETVKEIRRYALETADKGQGAGAGESDDGDGDAGGERPAKKQTIDEEVLERPVTEDEVRERVAERAKTFAEEWFWPGEGDDNPYAGNSSPTARDAQKAIKRILAAMDEKQYEVRSGLASALDLRLAYADDPRENEAEDEDEDQDPKTAMPSVQTLLARIAQHLHDYQQVASLAQSRRAWSILKNGALARALGVDDHRLDTYARAIEDALDTRMQHGRAPLPPLCTREVLAQLLDTTAAQLVAEAYDDPPDVTTTPFRAPATPQDIAATEARLGCELPADYKAFVSLSNGFGAAYNGLGYEPALRALSDVHWTTEEYFTSLPLSLAVADEALYRLFPAAEMQAPSDWHEVGPALAIGARDIYNTWLVPPATMARFVGRLRGVLVDEQELYDQRAKTGLRNALRDVLGGADEAGWEDGRWACVTWASGSVAVMRGFEDFEAYLRGVLWRARTGAGEPWEDGAPFLGVCLRGGGQEEESS
ncbi:hypothetical protein BDV95DRAFT_642961 [Massariosphaeria phaeospora]|uniref:Knr4/Smi1-like domain-containing protein n=1 Tax=Massariosphaeria phaeospora TaxID=100035 RepID=A0A7C8M5K2_9PLEO|nr:hypothetical protein BDV95DRAFT_642961 [Massariosphaeria phaeospora]